MENSYVQSPMVATPQDYAKALMGEIPALRSCPESIDDGRSGILLFLMESLRHSNEPACRAFIEAEMADLFAYCDRTPTSNYAFYNGRSGVIYVAIQWYLVTGNSNLLSKCLELIRPSIVEYLHSPYTTDYLYDGRAGTLLVILELYLMTREDFLEEYIRQFAKKIVANSQLSDDGVFWISAEEVNLRPSPGFAFGTAGIRYVLEKLNRYCRNSPLHYLIGGTEKYIDSCWVDKFNNWGNFRKEINDEKALHQYCKIWSGKDRATLEPVCDAGWANGTAGILIATANKMLDQIPDSDSWMTELMTETGSRDNLQDGLAGLGMYLLLSAAEPCQTILADVMYSVSQGLPSADGQTICEAGLLHGPLGEAYFLLKADNWNNRVENILSPFRQTEPFENIGKIDLQLNPSGIRKDWWRKNYPRTVALLESVVPDPFMDFCKKHQAPVTGETAGLGSFMDNLLRDNAASADYYCLKDLYVLEQNKLNFLHSERRSSFQFWLDERLRHEHALQCLNRPFQWLLEQTLVISGQVTVLTSKWDWKFENDFGDVRAGQIENLGRDPGKFEYLVQVSGKAEAVEFALKMDTSMLLHQFDRPGTVKKALAEISGYIHSLPKTVLQELVFLISKSHDTIDFLDQLDSLILFSIRQWIYRGILAFHQ